MTKRPERNRRRPAKLSSGDAEEAKPDLKKESLGSNCGICGKHFKFEHKLRVHLRIHTGETPYGCSYCNKAFAQKAALTVHERTHTGEKPFVCEQCDKAFARADHLNQHSRTHTGEKPLSCDTCGKSFATWAAISRHKNEHSQKENVPCPHCPKTFSRTDNLRTHMQKAHNSKLDQTAKKPKAVKKKRAQAKPKDAKESGSSSDNDLEAIAKILEDDEDNRMPDTGTKVKDEPTEQDEANEVPSVVIHDSMEMSQEDDMLGSHFLFASQ